jgi:hypothetical protein
MSTRTRCVGSILGTVLIIGLESAAAAAMPVGTGVAYQGQLKEDGAPANGSYVMEFRLFDAEEGGAQIGPTLLFDGQGGNPPPVDVEEGLFSILLDFGASVFDGEERWLLVAVEETPLLPRQAVTPSPYALFSAAPWETSGTDVVYSGGNVGIGTTAPTSLLDVAGMVVSSGAGGGALRTLNPGNPGASATLGWLNNTARIRIGGSGPGATGGLDIQRGGDVSLMRIADNGAVGIGDTNPQFKLTVAGTVYSKSGGFRFPDGTTQVTAATGGGNSWSLTGNTGTDPSTNFVGTIDNVALNLRVNDARALRLEPGISSPNIIGGYSGNSVADGASGAANAGGGAFLSINRINDNYGTIGGGTSNSVGVDDGNPANQLYGTVGGGLSNSATNLHATVGGGQTNTASGGSSTIAGGSVNLASGGSSAIGGGFSHEATGIGATIAGGVDNTATGDKVAIGGGETNVAGAEWAVVAGGLSNTADGENAAIGGGGGNQAGGLAATIGGGSFNVADGDGAAVPGGTANRANGANSLATGYRAKADHDGSFVWADSTEADFVSTAPNQFLIRATSGVGIGSTDPKAPIHILSPAGAPPIGLNSNNNGLLLGTNGTASYKWLQSYGGALSLNPQGNSVGIGTTAPAHRLHVVNGASGQAAGFFNSTASSGASYGVRADASSTQGTGVEGNALTGTGATTGVRGVSVSTQGIGVSGFATGQTGATVGVYGQAISPQGTGVLAEGSSATGTALTIDNGSIRVPNAHFSSSTPAFVVTSTDANTQVIVDDEGTDVAQVFIDHPLSNDDPDALVLLTCHGKPLGGGRYRLIYSGVTVVYSTEVRQRCICFPWSLSEEELYGVKFSVLLIKS